jgi:hypothetical protein
MENLLGFFGVFVVVVREEFIGFYKVPKNVRRSKKQFKI